MASPDKIRKSNDFAVIAEMVSAEPTISTIIHENSNTTTVLSAVATSESVSRIPHFARIEVIPAKNADKTAIISHMSVPFLSVSAILLLYHVHSPHMVVMPFGVSCLEYDHILP